MIAHPIVESPPTPPPTANRNDDAADAATDADVANEFIASKTAAAQALQSKASIASGNIDGHPDLSTGKTSGSCEGAG